MEILDYARGIIEYGEEAEREYARPLAEAIIDEAARPMRYALVSVDVGKAEQIKAYMPGNYEVVGRTPIGGTNTVSVLIAGRDSAGWTLDGYVLPRLASGMYYGVEIG